MSNAIADYLKSNDLKIKLSENALKDSRNYTWERSAERVLEIIGG